MRVIQKSTRATNVAIWLMISSVKVHWEWTPPHYIPMIFRQMLVEAINTID